MKQSLAFTSAMSWKGGLQDTHGLVKLSWRKIITVSSGQSEQKHFSPLPHFSDFSGNIFISGSQENKNIHLTKNDARKKLLFSYFYIPFIIGEFVAMVVGRNNIHQQNIFSLWI